MTHKNNKKRMKSAVNKPCIYCTRLMVKRGSEEYLVNPGLACSQEHIIPRARGGTDDEDNLALSCERCNQLKGHIMPEIFEPFARIVVKKYPDTPTPILKDALRQYIVSLAEIAVRNRVATKKALLVSLLQLGEQLKGRGINA